MKTDLDRIMEKHGFDALLITGPAQNNPAMFYLTGGGHLSSADLIKLRGKAPILFYNSMERDEAAKTGLEGRDLSSYHMHKLLDLANGNYTEATALRYKKMLTNVGLTKGRIAIYGKVEVGAAFGIFSVLQNMMPDISIVGETNHSVMLEAMATKDEDEIARIREMGKITVDVVGEVANFLTSCKVKDGVLLARDGSPLTIKTVKNKINLWIAERGASNPYGCVFAMGRDAGVPHSSGNPSDILRTGVPIVFDIFPTETGGGYHFDFTRTWCLGYAPDDVMALYNDVYEVYKKIISELKVNGDCKQYQERTCELFSQLGHPTVKDDPELKEGYVHSVGHGLGLYIHERPWFSVTSTDDDVLAPGVVVTIEPGLYYPSRNMGVRLEDSVAVMPNGEIQILAEYPMDLVLPMKV